MQKMQQKNFGYTGQDMPIEIGQMMHVDSFVVHPFYRPYLEGVLIPEGAINARIDKLAMEIAKYYEDRPYIILIVLKGAATTFKKLETSLTEIYRRGVYNNFIQAEYVKCSSYKNDQSLGEVEITSFFNLDSLKDKEVLIVEDIVDTGLTLQQFTAFLKKKQVKSLKIASFLQKVGLKEECKYKDPIDFLGFIGPPYFYVGFGLDYNELFRDLTHLAALNDKGKEKFKQVQQ